MQAFAQVLTKRMPQAPANARMRRISHANCQESLLNPSPELLSRVLPILDSTLGLRGRALHFTGSTRLLSALPELDSMAVVALVTVLEEQLALVIDDEDLEASTFATVGTLCTMLQSKLSA